MNPVKLSLLAVAGIAAGVAAAAGDWRTTPVVGGKGDGVILAACTAAVADNAVYFLAYDAERNFSIRQVDRLHRERQVATLPEHQGLKALSPAYYKYPDNKSFWLLHVDDTHIVVTGAQVVFVGRRGERELKILPELPFDIVAFWVNTDRIFALGERELMSFDFSGNARVTHFAAGQEAKVLPIQRQLPLLKAAYACRGANDNEVIVIFFGYEESGIWSFDLVSGESQRIAGLPGFGPEGWAPVVRAGDTLFLYGDTNRDGDCAAYFQYSIPERSLRVTAYKEIFPFADTWRDAPDYRQAIPLPAVYSTPGAFPATLELIWQHAIRPFPANGVFPCPDGSGCLAVERERIVCLQVGVGE